MTGAVAFAAVAFGSWCLRSAFITMVDVDRLPVWLRRGLDHVGPAVLAALVAAALVGDHGSVAVSPAEIGGLAVAVVVARRTGSLLWALAAAMGAFVAVGLVAG